ncbi:ubiquitin-conjugating enzyme 16 [Actinidia rufa]|uniref:Ubiquitin-conjugating enzyme 16 n=1 Tax=Actinidia rufa TaxID=165716 RepID=A0A7J0E0B3_9ERIC|nr:ubiquitin-conjugating enzyme 16 [Actinidia rufa]
MTSSSTPRKVLLLLLFFFVSLSLSRAIDSRRSSWNGKLIQPQAFKHKVSDNLQRWVIEVNGASGTLYANDIYQLQVDFPEHYPMEAPQQRPADNDRYVKNCKNGRSPKETRWWFHDDKV